MVNTWWAEKYRPRTVEDYVAEPEFKKKIQRWVEDDEINHLLLYSEKPGSGKTTLAKLIASLLDADVLYINASDENSVDVMREKLHGFVSSMGFSNWKIVILDEADFLTQNSMAILRNMMETYSKSSRFILTCNYVDKIIPAIKSRCTSFQIETPPKMDILRRMQFVLNTEGIQFEDANLAEVIKRYYPDQRSILNYLQDNTKTGKLILSNQNVTTDDNCARLVNILRDKSTKPKECFTEIRQYIADNRIKHYNDIFRYMYDNVDSIVPSGKQGVVILQIADAQYKDGLVVDKEINFMALIVNLLNILN